MPTHGLLQGFLSSIIRHNSSFNLVNYFLWNLVLAVHNKSCHLNLILAHTHLITNTALHKTQLLGVLHGHRAIFISPFLYIHVSHNILWRIYYYINLEGIWRGMCCTRFGILTAVFMNVPSLGGWCAGRYISTKAWRSLLPASAE